MQTGPHGVRVLVADDNLDCCEALAAMVRAADPSATVECVPGPAEMVNRAEAGTFDLFVVGSRTGADGLDAARRVRELRPEAGVVVLTSRGGPAELRAALAAGATGFLLKTDAQERLAAALLAEARGHRVFSDELVPGG